MIKKTNKTVNNPTDSIYSVPLDKIDPFCFNDEVANVFNDMIQRSVPGYASIIYFTGIIGAKYVQENTNIYDLGASLGASSISIIKNLKTKNNTIYTIDSSRAMIRKCKKNLEKYTGNYKIKNKCDDIKNIEIQNASLVILNFTLQFIKQKNRTSIIEQIYKGLNKNGVLIISEKIKHEKSFFDNEFSLLHMDFKRNKGYSELEISQKRTSLEKMLMRDSTTTHMKRLKKVGFRHITQWFQCLNFSSFIAIK